LAVVAIAVAIADDVTEKKRGNFGRHDMAAARALYRGEDPYALSEYSRHLDSAPPYLAFIYPLARLERPVAQGVWIAFCLGILWIALAEHLTLLRFSGADRRALVLATIVGGGVAVRYAWDFLKTGSEDGLAYTLAFIGGSLALRSTSKEGGQVGGHLLGLATCLGLWPSILLVPLAVKRRVGAIVAWFAGVVVWGIMVPMLVATPLAYRDTLQSYYERQDQRIDATRSTLRYTGVSARVFFQRLVAPAVRTDCELREVINVLDWWPGKATKWADILCAVTVVVALGITWRARRQPEGVATLWTIGLWMGVSLSVAHTTRKPELIALLTPAIASAGALFIPHPPIRRPMGMAVRGLLIASVALGIGCALATTHLGNRVNFPMLADLYGTHTLALMAMVVASAVGLAAPNAISGSRTQ